MRRRNHGWNPAALCVLAVLCLSAAGVEAQSSRPNTDRLFLSFAEDASLVEAQWWEGQGELVDFDPVDATILRGVVALQPLEDLEVGFSVGFGSTDAPIGIQDGSGATDLDIWSKLHLPGGSGFEYALGGKLTVPTGDDAVGLGYDAFGVSLFASAKRTLDALILSGNGGIQFNEDGRILGVDLDGENVLFVAGGVVYPLAGGLNLVGELRLATERFERTDEDIRALGGVNWRVSDRGILRGALVLGIEDGAPDSQIIFGYAHDF